VSTISRRDVLRKGVGATIVAPLARLAPAAAATVASTAGAGSALAAAVAAGLFFTASEMALLDELTEAIIPADAQSGGARAAGVVPFLDKTLAEKDAKIPEYAEERKVWKAGLARVDEVAREMHGKAFLEATPDQRLAVLERMAHNEEDPKSSEERFFRQLKRATAQVYYTSKIGIHDDIQYKGNTLLTEFVGTDVGGIVG
jgi:Gluconate 2-dehydrogenase subunit 3